MVIFFNKLFKGTIRDLFWEKRTVEMFLRGVDSPYIEKNQANFEISFLCSQKVPDDPFNSIFLMNLNICGV